MEIFIFLLLGETNTFSTLSSVWPVYKMQEKVSKMFSCFAISACSPLIIRESLILES
jgi:hypothetical protein